MSRIRARAGGHLADALVVVAATVGVLEVVLGPSEAPLWVGIPAIAVLVLLLLARHRFPFAAPAAVWVVGAAASFLDGMLVSATGTALVAGLAAAFLLGGLREPVPARVGLVIALAGAAIVVDHRTGHEPSDFVFTPMLFAVAWLAGLAVRVRTARAEAAEARAVASERERRIAVAEERSRIARELHDVVAHSVSVMVLQVGAVRHGLPPASAEARDALESVERTGRAALLEMRSLLGAMRVDGEPADLAPQPSLHDLGELAAQVGRAGLPVQVRVEGDAVPLPRALEVSAYRIIQEGLTNALKHAHARQAKVSLRYAGSELRIEVSDDGRGARDDLPHESGGDQHGHGLVGIRERVKIYGGQMTAGTRPAGGYALSARLPLLGDRP